VTQGPYYVIGENIRHDVREDQEGVEVFLDMQFIDTNTCEPVTGIYMDIWHANATGVYSGINESGNGNSDDLTNLDKTFLRGIWQTDDEGVVQFQTIFPGHYNGRATHIHVVAHSGGYIALNGTFHGGNITHVGQFFMDEDLRSAVETVEPYVSNTQAVTTNDDDQWASSAAGDESYDPFLNYVYLGDKVEDGLLMWVEVGIDSSADYNDDVDYAAELTEDGGVTNDEFSLGGGSGGDMGGNGTMPSGAMPSGTGAQPSSTVAP
jgi:protocatechuate 3,4-dioxygenase beta subunit